MLKWARFAVQQRSTVYTIANQARVDYSRTECIGVAYAYMDVRRTLVIPKAEGIPSLFFLPILALDASRPWNEFN